MIGFNLDYSPQRANWLGTLRRKSGGVIPRQLDLIEFPAVRIRVFAENPLRLDGFWIFGRRRISIQTGNPTCGNLTFPTQPSCLAQSTRASDIADSGIATERGKSKTSINMNTDSGTPSP